MEKIMFFIFIIFFVTLQCKENSKFLDQDINITDRNYEVQLLVYSGTKNPSFTITQLEFDKINKIILNSKFSYRQNTKVMGYKGFIIKIINTIKLNNYTKLEIFEVKGNPIAEIFLLDKIKQYLPNKVYIYILQTISENYEVNENNLVKYNSGIYNNYSYNCSETPIRGSDTIPVYNPYSDNFGCFQDKQYDNNCYNYGNDIVTNTFAQPGRGTEHKWKENTCEDVRRAALSDGLIWIGIDYPKNEPQEGHYLALLIWPETNFHWIRLDSNGLWSHKPGGSPVKNTDNHGDVITNPSTQNFSPWTQFCGYFLTVPSKVTIE